MRHPIHCCGFFLCFALLSGSTGFGQGVPTLIPTNHRDFSIPFELKPDHSADPVKNVELLYSRDRGVQWHVHGRKSVEDKKFDFQAPEDGEYRFAFRTVTLSGTVKQSGVGAGQLRVLVDTTAPEITLESKQLPDGQIQVRWTILEANLQSNRPRFSLCFNEKKDVWTSLNVDPRNVRTSDRQIDGSFLFWPKNEATTVDVRVIIEDVAGNKAEKTDHLPIKPVHRDAEALLQEAIRTQPVIEAPDAPVQGNTGREMPAFPTTTGPRPEETSATVSVARQGAIPLTPPKPVRIRRPAKQDKSPGGPLLENSDSVPSASPMPMTPESDTADQGVDPAEPDLTQRLLSSMNDFLGDELKAVFSEGEKKTAAEVRREPAPVESGPIFPAPAEPATASERTNLSGTLNRLPPGRFPGISTPPPVRRLPSPASSGGNSSTLPPIPLAGEASGVSVESRPTPGRISEISLSGSGRQAQIVVKWVPGERTENDWVDVLRAASPEGPWLPIATNQPNSGEYWWYLTPSDAQPFYLMLRIRTPGGVHQDLTKSPINVGARFSSR